jgi:hypothetical protein
VNSYGEYQEAQIDAMNRLFDDPSKLVHQFTILATRWTTRKSRLRRALDEMSIMAGFP